MNLIDPNNFDPADSIRRNRVHNMGSDRLVMRARNIVANRHSISDGRMGFAFRMAELEAVRVELVRRHGPAVLLLAPGINADTDRRVLELAAA
jgi:hypothetical protein